jgi:hypothetical protein
MGRYNLARGGMRRPAKEPTMFGIGYWEMIILGIFGLICVGVIGVIVAAVVSASSSRRASSFTRKNFAVAAT